MSPPRDNEDRVRSALDELLGALSSLTDELATARSPSWDEQGDVETSGRYVLQVSSALASSLVDAFAELELEYDELDAVLASIAGRLPEAPEAAELAEQLFEALRKSSYDAFDLDAFPDVEATSAAIEELVSSLLRKGAGHELV